MVCEQTINRGLKIQRMRKLLSFTRINITVTKHWPFRRTQHSELIYVGFTIHSYTLDRLWRKCWQRGALTSLWSGSDPILEEGKLWEGTGRHSPSHIPSSILLYLFVSCMNSTAAYFDYSLQYNDKNSVLLLLYHFETPICLHSTMSVRISHTVVTNNVEF